MPVSRSSLVAAALAALITCAQAAAQATPPVANEPELAALVREALERNPGLRAAQEAVAAARSRPAQARSLPNPTLGLSYTNDGWSPSLGSREMTTLALVWSQDLPYPGKRGLRAEIASREADAVERQLERVRLSLAAAVKRAYVGLLLTRHQIELRREQEQTWREVEQLARTRYSVGQGAQQDVLRVQVEVTRIEQLRAEQAAEAEIRLAELNGLLDRPADAALETTARLALQAPEDGLAAWLARLEAISPELRNAQVAVERDRLAVALARKEFKPDFNLQFGYMSRGGLDPMWQGGVAVSLPLHRERPAAALAEAEARLRESERRVESVRLQLRFRTQERLAQIRSAETVTSLYEKGLIPQDQMSVEAAVASYQSGRVPFVAVLEALTTLNGDRSAYNRSLAVLEKTRASLEEASLEAGSELGAMESPRDAAASSSMAGVGQARAGAMGSMGIR